MFIEPWRRAITTHNDRPRYRIKTVGQKTGLSPITIRAWERRYQVLTPSREENRYRLYSLADIEILNWLRSQVDSGVAISQAALELNEMKKSGQLPELSKDESPKLRQAASSFPLQETVNKLYEHLREHDERKAAAVFERAAASLPLIQLFEQVLIPILIRIGEDWYLGKIMIATEHFASSFIRGRLMQIFTKLPMKRKGPHIVIGTAPHDLHELGTLMLAILIREAGYVVEFIGPDTPLVDLADYAAEENIYMVILSATTLESAEALAGFAPLLKNMETPPIFAFGGAAFSYKPELVEATPGIYLGKTIEQSLERVRSLMKSQKAKSRVS
jgi:DNA-binding transcriptional MerR regulator/methylmalonyl-CoA mutase cobalamin-binding subunit